MAFPSPATNGQTATVGGIVYTYNSTKGTWTRTGIGGSGGSVGVTYTASSTAPAISEVGDEWYDTTSDILYLRATNGTSTFWLDFTSQGNSFANLTATTAIITNANITNGNITTGNITTGNITTVNSGNVNVTGNISAANINATANLTLNNAKVATTGKAIAMAMVFGG